MKNICVYEESLYVYIKNNINYCEEYFHLVNINDFRDNLSMLNDDDMLLFVVANNRKLECCLNECSRSGIKRAWIVELYYIDRMIPFVLGDGKFTGGVRLVDLSKPFIVHLETHINDYCNLNCKACNNFSPWVSEKVTISIDSLKKDLIRLNSVANIGRLYLLGGEPLLEAEMVMESLDLCRKILPFTEIRLLTNGLLVSKMNNNFWKCMNDNSIILYITQYPPTMKMLQTIKSVLVQNGIKYVLGPEVKVFEKRWTRKPLEDAVNNSKICSSSGCHYFGNGFISKCPDASTIHYVNDMSMIGDRSVKSIDGIKDTWDICYDLENPSDMCRYCAIERAEVIPWEPVKCSPKLSDWFIDDKEIYVEKVRKVLNQYLLSKNKKNTDKILIWGLGNKFDNCYKTIKDYMDIDYVFDKNNERAIEISYKTGIPCWNYEMMTEKNIVCFIMIDNPVYLLEVVRDLMFKDILFIHIDEWFEYLSKWKEC